MFGSSRPCVQRLLFAQWHGRNSAMRPSNCFCSSLCFCVFGPWYACVRLYARARVFVCACMRARARSFCRARACARLHGLGSVNASLQTLACGGFAARSRRVRTRRSARARARAYTCPFHACAHRRAARKHEAGTGKRGRDNRNSTTRKEEHRQMDVQEKDRQKEKQRTSGPTETDRVVEVGLPACAAI
eukprot:6207424-Pleurochrysis_carterae.AAC.6